MVGTNKRESVYRALRFSLVTVIGGLLFAAFVAVCDQTDVWKGTPVMGYFIGTIWLYVFGLFSGFASTMLGFIIFACSHQQMWTLAGWVVGDLMLTINIGFILLMFREFIPLISDSTLREKFVYVTVLVVGAIASTFYCLGLFKSITDWIVTPTALSVCMKSGVQDSLGALIAFFLALPAAVFLDKAVAFFNPKYVQDRIPY